MSSQQATHPVASLFALGSSSVLAAGIVVAAPDLGLAALSTMIVVWVVLGVVRVVILLGIARQISQRCSPDHFRSG